MSNVEILPLMNFCSICGTKIIEDSKFCPKCGTTVGTTAKQGNQQGSTAFDQNDIEKNKAMGILAYLGILVLVPIFAAKDSPFARFHANQGLILCLSAIAYGILYSILSTFILMISWRLYFLVSILGFVGIVFLVLCIIGIINAVNGQAKELPIIGKFSILK